MEAIWWLHGRIKVKNQNLHLLSSSPSQKLKAALLLSVLGGNGAM